MKKKIFFIINCFSMGGGAESLLTQIVNNLNPRKYEIGIMEIVHHAIKVEPINETIKMYPYYVKANDPQRKRKMYYVYHEWDKVIQEYIPQDYDLYVSFNYLKPSFLLPPGKKNIAWIHSDVYDLMQDGMQEERKLQNKAFYKANRIVSISDITTNSLLDLFPEHKEKVRIIYNGIDIERVRSRAKKTSEVCLEHPAILSIGRLEPRKNPLRMLEIYEKVYEKDKKVHLYYLGLGELEEVVKKMAEEKGLIDHVHLLGYYDNPFPIIAQCDVSCMFSLSEGFPMALLESVSLDKPFVSSEIGGAKILANNQKCGKVVHTDEEAVEAICGLLQQEKQEIVKACQESVVRFRLDKYIKTIENLFDEVLNE